MTLASGWESMIQVKVAVSCESSLERAVLLFITIFLAAGPSISVGMTEGKKQYNNYYYLIVGATQLSYF